MRTSKTTANPRSALIICNGEAPSPGLLQRLARSTGYVVAADGGANAALYCGVTPDVIIGDLDSLRPSTRRAFPGAEIIRMPRQDNTDLEKALDFLVEQRITCAFVTGVTGGRIDFTIGNLSILWQYTQKLEVIYAGDDWYAVPVGKERTVRAKRGTTVSLIPFGSCAGITLRGLLYPLRDAALPVGQIAVSNVVKSSPFTVSVRRGHLLLVVAEQI